MSSLLGIQLIGIFFALLLSYVTFVHFRKKEFTPLEATFWIGLWIIFLFLSIFPAGLDFFIKNWLNFSRRLDFFIILGFLFIIAMIFYVYRTLRRTQRSLENLIQKLALQEHFKK